MPRRWKLTNFSGSHEIANSKKNTRLTLTRGITYFISPTHTLHVKRDVLSIKKVLIKREDIVKLRVAYLNITAERKVKSYVSNWPWSLLSHRVLSHVNMLFFSISLPRAIIHLLLAGSSPPQTATKWDVVYTIYARRGHTTASRATRQRRTVRSMLRMACSTLASNVAQNTPGRRLLPLTSWVCLLYTSPSPRD